MTQNERINLYKYKTNIKIKEVQVIKICITDSYRKNKNIILNVVPGEIKTGIKGKKYYKSKPGIWAVRDINGQYYDIAETSSILNEMIKAIQLFSTCKRDVRKNIYKQFQRQVYKRYKFQQIYKSLDRKKILEFVILEYEEDKNSRLEKELKYAIKTKAKFWSPAPKQKQLIIKMIKGEN